MTKLRILTICNSTRKLQLILKELCKESDFKVVGNCSTLMEAYNCSEEQVPDIALIAQDYTYLPEFEMVRALFSLLDIRWLTLEDADTKGKQTHGGGDIFAVNFEDLNCTLVQTIKSVTAPKRQALQAHDGTNIQRAFCDDRIVLVGCSTGGIEALSQVLANYPKDCPPTFIVQHTGRGFGQSLVRLLNHRSNASIVMAEDRLLVQRGLVCVAAGNPWHMTIAEGKQLRIKCLDTSPSAGHRPSVDVLFDSAVRLGKRVVAGVMTGMGSDGAAGLLKLRRAGATTFAQDQNTSAVYGMPRVAWENGGAQTQVPLNRIADHILQSCSQRTQTISAQAR